MARALLIYLGLALAGAVLPAGAAETVQVRGGQHEEGYARVAVEWPLPVAFDTKLDGTTLTIHFARPFTAELAALRDQLDRYVSSAGQSADGTSIVLKLIRPVDVKTATVNGTIVAVDLYARPGTTPAPTAKKPAPPKQSAQKPAVARAARKTDEKKVETAKTPAVPSSAPSEAVSPAVSPPAATPPTNLTPADIFPVIAATAPADTAASPMPAAEAPLSLPAAITPARDGKAGPSPAVTIAGEHVSLRFDWPAPTGAAVWRRGGAIWIVFAAPATLDLSAARAQAPAAIRAIDEVPVENATVLRLIAADGINPSLRRTGNAWTVDLAPREAGPDAPIAVDARPAAAPPEVELRVHDSGPAIRLRDPVLGDRLLVVPVGETGRGVAVARDFVDFRLLPSMQGVVLRPISDDIDVKLAADGVAITRPQGLVLSDDHDRVLGRTVASQHRMFDFATWRGPADQSFTEHRAALERTIAAAAPGARTAPRLALARFYFANLFAVEALSVLAQIGREDQQAAADDNLRALKGAACLLAGIDDCASQELGRTNLDSEPEAAIWRGSLAAGKGDWPAAAREFLRGVAMLATYPKTLRDRFALQAAETMVETDRAGAALPLIEMVQSDDPDNADQAMALYLQGRSEQQSGHPDAALAIWAKVAAMDDRKARARALYARAMTLYETDKASRADTIKALDALRFAWRGDAFEFTLLRRLGELKLAEGDAQGGLEALHLASAYFPDYPAAAEVKKEAADTFADLFLGTGADDLPPVKALALYESFHDLDPDSARHDAIVKRLVDRLVAVDLLDRAIALLDDQVKSRLTGLDKARGATQMALLRLMNHQPEDAVAALDIDVGAGLPPDLARQRQELRARALLDLDRAPEALSILSGDDSRDAWRLRADISWRQRDWKNAAKAFATLAGQPPAQGPLDAETARIVLSWAAALTLDGDQQGLAILRRDFGPAVVGTQVADAFNVIAGDVNAAAAGGGAPNEIAARVAQLGALQNFMSAYKQRLASAKLSTIN